MAAATGISITFIVFILFVAIGIVIPVAIGVYVYRDAQRRGMNALLWTVIAALAPGFVGLIVYLVVRSNYSGARCINCGASVLPDFVVCPHCGTGLKPTCTNCGYALENDWALCPGCGTPIDDENRGGVFYDHTPTSDRGLITVLIAVIAIPIVLIIVIAVISALIMGFNTTVHYGEVDYGEEYVTQIPVESEIMVDTVPAAAEIVDVTVIFDEYVHGVYSVRLNSIENNIIVSSETAMNADYTEIRGGESFNFICEFPIWSAGYFTIELLDENGHTLYESEVIYPYDSEMKVVVTYDSDEYMIIYG